MFKNGGKMVKFIKKQRLLFLVVFVVSQLHEFGHVIGYSIENVSIKFHYGYVEPLNGKIGVLGIMGGPIASILFAIIPLIILSIVRKYNYVLSIISLASSLSRVSAYALYLVFLPFNENIFMINDEGQAAKLLGINPVFFYVASIIAYILSIIFIRKCGIHDKKKYWSVFLSILIYNVIVLLTMI